MACSLTTLGPATNAAVTSADDAPEPVVVTATRTPEPIAEVPAFISLISGREMLVRGTADLATSLALVPGAEAPAGGDAGPSSAVPSFWGLHEFDAFLLLVDGVPWGGAFNPAITTLNFTGTDRVEVLKGAAPVMYGATSFVGVVQLLHYPAGRASDELDLAYGNDGSGRGSASLALPAMDGYRHSLNVDGESLGFADGREQVADGHALYRGALDLERGTLRVDVDLSVVRDVPPSPVLRSGAGLSALTPLDANFNPADARIDEDKNHMVLGYSRPTAFGAWDTLVSVAHSRIADVRGFLHADDSGTADTQNQHRRIDDDYVDSHFTRTMSAESSVVVGVDLLYGHGRQTSLNGNGGYTVPLSGAVLPPPTTAVPITEVGTIDDERIFTGQYAQFDWNPGGRFDVVGGLRLNEAYERKDSSDFTLPPPTLASENASKTLIRPTEILGLSYRLWAADRDATTVFADFRNAFKPAAIDFGPDYTPDLLRPETAQSYELGLKGVGASGRLTYQADLFLLDFNNLVVATSSGALANAAAERLKGVEAESRFAVTPDLALLATASYHDARYCSYGYFDGTSTIDVAGRRLTLSPRGIAAAGLIYAPQHGLLATVVARYVGRRFLDEENRAAVGGYANLDANLGYAWDHYRVTLDGNNLTDQRPPVTASEFGSQSFYLLPARRIWLRFAYSWH